MLITCTRVTTLYTTTITIANVSLPQIRGAMSASPDQIAWVITANLIATAVTIPVAGFGAHTLAGISDEISRQAVTIGFVNSFHLFTWFSLLLVYPLIALVVWPGRR